LVHDLNFALETFVRQKKDKAFKRDFHKDYEDTIYHKGDEDKYSQALNNAVQNYEKILKPHLKK
jgi:outer membrane protein assembly factor BamD (BamD/ComL family)